MSPIQRLAERGVPHPPLWTERWRKRWKNQDSWGKLWSSCGHPATPLKNLEIPSCGPLRDTRNRH